MLCCGFLIYHRALQMKTYTASEVCHSSPDEHRAPKILFVCYADSTHSQAWLDLLRESSFDVRVFASPVDYGGMFPPREWHFPTYSLTRRTSRARVRWLFPNINSMRRIVTRFERRFDFAARWLRHIIKTWQPDIVHTLRLNPEAWLTHRALEAISPRKRPKWIVSSWGSELNVEAQNPEILKQITFIMQDCDGFIADCHRDIELAIRYNLNPSKVLINDAIPVTGGLELADFANVNTPLAERNLIVVSKAYEGVYHRTLPILEALRLAENALSDYEIHLLICADEVREKLQTLPVTLQRKIHARGALPQPQVFDLLRCARVMIATSLSDGTPNAMLEAMASGALPIMSPLDSIQDWIQDGRNGLFASALDAEQIAAAIKRAARDDALCDAACHINRRLVATRANRAIIKQQVLALYQDLKSR